MSNDPNARVTYLGRANHRNNGTLFGIRQRDRRSHLYVCGKTGTGKSHFLRTLILQDISAGRGCALFDPHGDLAREVLAQVPDERRRDVLYFDAGDPQMPWRFNPLAGIPESERALACAGMIEVFKNLWSDDWGPRLEHLLRNVVFTLLEVPDSTLGDVNRLLTERSFRSSAIARIEDEIVKAFWKEEFERYSPGFRAVVVAPLQNKVGALMTDPMLRRVLTESGGQQLDLTRAMDDGRILLINLDKGRIGEGPSALLGSLLVSHIALAGLARSKRPLDDRRDFMVYMDEFQTFTTLSIAGMLSELRKYGVGMILSHQHLSQLEPEIRDSVFGNAGTIVSFRVGAADAAYLTREFAPVFESSDLTNLPRYSVYIRLLVDGQPSRPFSASTLSDEDLTEIVQVPERDQTSI
jgi:hypothetical protein